MTLPDLPPPFTTLAAPHRHDAVTLGSEFLAFAERADTPEAALAGLAALRARSPDATHHCWAYRIASQSRFSDDGEPGGTAGAPILRAALEQGVDHVMVVVVRYFGGVKLGTAPRETVRPLVTLSVSVTFEHLSALYHLLGTFDAQRGEEVYTASGVSLAVRAHPEEAEVFAAALRDATRGAARVETT